MIPNVTGKSMTTAKMIKLKINNAKTISHLNVAIFEFFFTEAD